LKTNGANMRNTFQISILWIETPKNKDVTITSPDKKRKGTMMGNVFATDDGNK